MVFKSIFHRTLFFFLTLQTQRTVIMPGATGDDTLHLQSGIKQDWDNREVVEQLSRSVKLMVDFLNSFGKTLPNLKINYFSHSRRFSYRTLHTISNVQ